MHIGKKIMEVWKNSKIKGTEFAALINRDRQVIYNIFKRESIDTELLKQIGKALNHDFFSYYTADPLVLKESKDKFGYATKDDVASILKMVERLTKVVEELQERIPAKKQLTEKKYSRSNHG
jgi:hypothetical protein